MPRVANSIASSVASNGPAPLRMQILSDVYSQLPAGITDRLQELRFDPSAFEQAVITMCDFRTVIPAMGGDVDRFISSRRPVMVLSLRDSSSTVVSQLENTLNGALRNTAFGVVRIPEPAGITARINTFCFMLQPASTRNAHTAQEELHQEQMQQRHPGWLSRFVSDRELIALKNVLGDSLGRSIASDEDQSIVNNLWDSLFG